MCLSQKKEFKRKGEACCVHASWLSVSAFGRRTAYLLALESDRDRIFSGGGSVCQPYVTYCYLVAWPLL